MSRHHGLNRTDHSPELTDREILALIDYLDPDRHHDEPVPSWFFTFATLVILLLLYAGILWLGHWLFS